MSLRRKTKRVIPTTPTEYPVGVCLKTEKGWYLLNKDGKRYIILTQRVLDSWNFPLIVTTSEAALVNYPIAFSKLPFRDGTLLNNVFDGKLYLVSEGKRRPVLSPDVLERLGISYSNAVVVSDQEIKLMKIGEPLT